MDFCSHIRCYVNFEERTVILDWLHLCEFSEYSLLYKKAKNKRICRGGIFVQLIQVQSIQNHSLKIHISPYLWPKFMFRDHSIDWLIERPLGATTTGFKIFILQYIIIDINNNNLLWHTFTHTQKKSSSLQGHTYIFIL